MSKVFGCIPIIAAALLLIGLADLPIGYYTFLRIVIFCSALFCIYIDHKYDHNYTIMSIVMGLIAIIFNPVFRVYFGNKSTWAPIDIITAFIFLVFFFIRKDVLKQEPDEK